VKVCAVIDQVFEPKICRVFFGGLFDPIVFDSFQLGFAVAGEIGDLSNGISFTHPKFKPMFFSIFFVIRQFPNV
jgi:hypothetical protein